MSTHARFSSGVNNLIGLAQIASGCTAAKETRQTATDGDPPFTLTLCVRDLEASEGVMMRGRRAVAVAVGAASGEILVRSEPIRGARLARRVRPWPIARGAMLLALQRGDEADGHGDRNLVVDDLDWLVRARFAGI